MAPGCAVLLALLLSTLQTCRARPTEQGLQWVWGVAEQAPAEPPLPSRRRRADTGPHSTAVTPIGNETTSPGHDVLMGMEPGNATRQPKALVVTTANPLDGSPEPHKQLGAELDNATSQALVLTTDGSLNETNSSQPLMLLGTEPPPKPGNTPRQGKALPVTTANPLNETNTPEPISLLGTELPPWVGNSTSQAKALVVTTTDPPDETDSPEPVPGTAPQSGSTVVPSQLMESTLWEENTTPLSTERWGTTAPGPSDELWDNSSLINKCLLTILLLALVAGLFMVCTAVLGTLLWRRVRTARRQLSPTEMICISSLLPDSERTTTNGPRLGVPLRHKLLVDAGSEADGDNLTLSSFLPDHS